MPNGQERQECTHVSICAMHPYCTCVHAPTMQYGHMYPHHPARRAHPGPNTRQRVTDARAELTVLRGPRANLGMPEHTVMPPPVFDQLATMP